MQPDATKKERSGWRDEGLSRRHREWGRPLHMTDIDWLVIEHTAGTSRALIEYKHECSGIDFTTSCNAAALRHVAGTNRQPLPLFLVRYWRDPWTFSVSPENATAKAIVSAPTTMNEREYVALLYSLRGLRLADQIAATLDTRIHFELGEVA